MSEMVVAYLLGPAVMLVISAAIWGVSRHSRGRIEARLTRWLDEHRGHWMHHRH
ncbi:hypothetical protein [Burkholderia sp. WAC0059]|uniref:hypothetical protein n=1 Tax=Burkholderia sp. WAC0059 TaxID=2066022 RepID=UPI0015E0BB39|nr:hypothetical protein [Burkholderia sp. WAC0059]